MSWDEFVKFMCSKSVDVCEKYQYPKSDEPLCLLVEDNLEVCKAYFEAKYPELDLNKNRG